MVAMMKSPGLRVGLTCAIVLLAQGPVLRAAPRFSVAGQPICASFAVKWLPDELRQAQATGINLVYCYDRRAGGQLLDPATELGAIALEGNTKVMANFLHYIHSAKLASDANATETALQVAGATALPDSGVLWIDDEAIAYTERDDQGVRGCQRGAEDTDPAGHDAGTYLLEEGTLRDELARCKASPNLWGFWALDDKKGNQVPALRNLYRLIRKYDLDEQGQPYNHVVVAGFASVDSLTNFDRDVCDMAGLYIYPARRGSYHINETEETLQQMVPTIRERDPDVGIIGIYQAFHGPKWEPKSTPLQVRQQVRDFLRWGASGVMAYSWRMVEGYDSLRNLADLRAEVGRIADDLRAGRLGLERTLPEVSPRAEFEVNADALVPVLRFDPEMQARQPSPGLKVEPGGLEGSTETWQHLHFEQYQQEGNQWPGIAFNKDAGDFSTTDWSAFGGFVVRVANLLPTDSEIGVTIHGVTGMWARYYPLPKATVHDVAVDLGEVRGAIPISQVHRFSVIMRRPPVPTHLALEGFYLAPMQFEAVQTQEATVPRAAVPPAADGVQEDTWQQAAELALVDETGEPPLKPCSVRLLHDEGHLHVLFECAVPDPELLRGTTATSDAAMAGEDLVEVLLRPEGDASVARLRVNPKGAVREEMLGPHGSDLAWSWGAQVQSRLEGTRWTVEMSLPMTPWGEAGGQRWEANFRRVDTELRPLAWVAESKPGHELLGRLQLQR